MSAEDFERLVDEALETIPPDLLSLVDNCVLLIEPTPPPEHPGVLGLYEGIPLPDRDSASFMGVPDRIYIYREPILAMCSRVEEVAAEVEITVVHEIAHFFGIEDERLHELGWA